MSGLGLGLGVRQDSRSARGGFTLPHVAVWNEDAWRGVRDNAGPHLDSHVYRTPRPCIIQSSEELLWSTYPSAVRIRDGWGSLGWTLSCLSVCSSQLCGGSSPRHTQHKAILEPSGTHRALFASVLSVLNPTSLPSVTLQVMERHVCGWQAKDRHCPDGD